MDYTQDVKGLHRIVHWVVVETVRGEIAHSGAWEDPRVSRPPLRITIQHALHKA